MVIGKNGIQNIASADVAYSFRGDLGSKKKKKDKHKQEPCVRQCVMLFQDSPENLCGMCNVNKFVSRHSRLGYLSEMSLG